MPRKRPPAASPDLGAYKRQDNEWPRSDEQRKLVEMQDLAIKAGLHAEWHWESGQTPVLILGDQQSRRMAATRLIDHYRVRMAACHFYYIEPLKDVEIEKAWMVAFKALGALVRLLQAPAAKEGGGG